MSQDRQAAAALVGAVFPDQGAALLSAVGLAETWDELLSVTPAPVWQGQPDGVSILGRLRDFWWARGAAHPAMACTRTLLAWFRSEHGDVAPRTLLEVGRLAALLLAQGGLDEAAQLAEHAWSGVGPLAGEGLVRAEVAEVLARVRHRQQRTSEAQELLTVAYTLREDLAPHTSGEVAAMLGDVRVQLGLHGESIAPLRRAWVLHKERLGTGHLATCRRALLLGLQLAHVNDYSALIAPVGEAARVLELKDQPRAHATARFLLGTAEYHTGNAEAAMRELEGAIRASRVLQTEAGMPIPQLAERLNTWASVLAERGRADEARSTLEEALDVSRTLHGAASPQVARATASLGVFEQQLGHTAAALSWLEAACSLALSALGRAHPETRDVTATLVEVATPVVKAAVARRDWTESGDLLGRVLPLATSVLGSGDARVVALSQLDQRRH